MIPTKRIEEDVNILNQWFPEILWENHFTDALRAWRYPTNHKMNESRATFFPENLHIFSLPMPQSSTLLNGVPYYLGSNTSTAYFPDEWSPHLYDFHFSTKRGSLKAIGPSDGNYQMYNAMLTSIPSYGELGLLLAFGGRDFRTGESHSFSTVIVYHLNTASWYFQRTRGSVPTASEFTCGGSVSNQDGTITDM